MEQQIIKYHNGQPNNAWIEVNIHDSEVMTPVQVWTSNNRGTLGKSDHFVTEQSLTEANEPRDELIN